MTVDETIRAILDQHGKLDSAAAKLGDDEDLYRHGLTSHASVNVMLGVEEALEVEFPDRLLRRSTFQSMRSIKEALAELGALDS